MHRVGFDRQTRHRHRQHGEILVLRPAMQSDGRMRPALRRLRLHVGIPHHPRLRRRARAAYLRRHERDHERGDYAEYGVGEVEKTLLI